MARTATKPTDERRAEILGVAAALLKSGGYKHMNVEALSAACRVSPAHLYNFFPAKIDIAVALADHESHALIAKVKARAKSGKPDQRLKKFLIADLELTYEFLETYPHYQEVLERIGRQRPKAANALLAAARVHLVEILKAGNADRSFLVKDASSTAEILQIAMLKFRFSQMITQLSLADLKREAEGVIECLLKGIESR